MESSSSDSEPPLTSISNYRFEDHTDQPVSFSLLPLLLPSNDAASSNSTPPFSLYGTVDNGLQKISKQVVAWKYDLSSSGGPGVSVLSKEGVWIELEGKPVKWYSEGPARGVLVALSCLHFARRNPEASPKSVWGHLAKVFSFYEVKPSQDDLVDQMDLIGEAVKRDASLSKSKFLLAFLEQEPDRMRPYNEVPQSNAMSEFIVDDVEDFDFEPAEEEDEAAAEDDLFDSVCAFCDNGGNILCCEGVCMRSFHAIEDPDEEYQCQTLGLTKAEVDAIKTFECRNCQYKQHQCYICGKLGNSDKSRGAEVFRCANATCGHFYHPHCVAEWLYPEDDVSAKKLQKNIASGESFTCPIHKCCVCHGGENKKEFELQFAVCRRCPASYHRKCMPSEIRFAKEEEEEEEQEEQEEEGEGEQIFDRAWQKLLPNRILIYCLKHDICEELGTPMRDHIRFPGVEVKKKCIPELAARKNLPVKKRKLDPEGSTPEKKVLPVSDNASSFPKMMKIAPKGKSIPDSRKKFKADASGMFSKEKIKSRTTKVDTDAAPNVKENSLGSKLFDYMINKPGLKKQETADCQPVKAWRDESRDNKLKNKAASLDADSKRRILSLMKESGDSITLQDVAKKYQVPSTHAYSSKNAVDKNITMGKVEGAVEAVRTALKKLGNNCSIEDAKAVCEPEVVCQIFKWQNKLKVYLAPFLHGTRYSSFGRHFTKVEKLEEIVNMLHWYVQSGDMIVDFCCGANDFSWILKKKLEERGKKCFFKNYDVFQPKNDFNFEKRDWMSVNPSELKKEGRPLIMGLNPPFGVQAALANKFINKALQFKPKLLILIVPPETERLDKKDPPYDLIWEDFKFCAGKSFYLPGSVDVNDKQMDQWNMTAPVLYLWSCRDWTAKHKAIAEKQGHISGGSEGSNGEDVVGRDAHEHSTKNFSKGEDHPSSIPDVSQNNCDKLVAEVPKSSSYQDTVVKESADGHRSSKRQTIGDSTNERHGSKRLLRGTGDSVERSHANIFRGGEGSNSEDGMGRHTHDHSTKNFSEGKNPPPSSIPVVLQKNCDKLVTEVHKSSSSQDNNVDKESKDSHGSSKRRTIRDSTNERHGNKRLLRGTGDSAERSHANSSEITLPRHSPSNAHSCRSWEGPFSRSLESSHARDDDDSHQPVCSRISAPNAHDRIPYIGSPAGIRGGLNRSYSSSNTELYSNEINGSSVGANMDGYNREYRSEAVNTGYLSYHAALDRETERWSQFHLVGQAFDTGFGRMESQSSTPNGHIGFSTGLSYRMSESAMQRYAPQLDELNHTGMNSVFAYEGPFMGGGPRPPQPGFQADSVSFGPGPHHPYSRSSSGWLND